MNIGFAVCGSFCTFSKMFPAMEALASMYHVIPIFSQASATTDTRFGNAEAHLKRAEQICGNAPILTITQAEPIGPKKLLDALVIAPCTGNTLAKLAHGITDTAVTMAAKSHLRNGRPLCIAFTTNDGLSVTLQNVGALLTRKNVYFVPFHQDDHNAKPNSLAADFTKLEQTFQAALGHKQLHPILSP